MGAIATVLAFCSLLLVLLAVVFAWASQVGVAFAAVAVACALAGAFASGAGLWRARRSLAPTILSVVGMMLNVFALFPAVLVLGLSFMGSSRASRSLIDANLRRWMKPVWHSPPVAPLRVPAADAGPADASGAMDTPPPAFPPPAFPPPPLDIDRGRP